MDSAVSLVQAYLRVNGYFTVTEYPVVEAMGRAPGYQEATDLDVLAIRFPGAARRIPGESRSRADRHPAFEPDPRIVADASAPDMVIGEVKQGTAELNPSARRKEVLAAALARFGCCPADEASDAVETLVREGSAMTPDGHRVRLVAFGSSVSQGGATAYDQISLGHVLEYLRRYIRDHWPVLRHAHFKDPVFAFLVLEEKVRKSGRASGAGDAG